MRPAAPDLIIADAKRRMRAAAEHYARALAELLPAMRALEDHPDFKVTVRRYKAEARSGEALTLAWWLHDCCLSALNDGREKAADWLHEDSAEGAAERSMRDFIEMEERELAMFARRRVRKARSAPPNAPCPRQDPPRPGPVLPPL